MSTQCTDSLHSTTHIHDSAFSPNYGGFALRRTGCMPVSMLAQPMAPMTPPQVGGSVEASKSTRALQVEFAQGVFPASVPVVRLADASSSSKAVDVLALFAVAGGLILTSLSLREKSSESSTTATSKSSASTATAIKVPETKVAPAPALKIKVEEKSSVPDTISAATTPAARSIAIKSLETTTADPAPVAEIKMEVESSASPTTSAATPPAATPAAATATAIKSPETIVAPAPVAPAPVAKIELATLALANMETPKTPEEIAKAYDKAREETQEITRIKNDFIARLEMAGLLVCVYVCVPMCVCL